MNRTAWFFVILLVIVPVGGIVAGYVWWQSNGEDVMRILEDSVADGMKYGASSNESGCVDHIMAMHGNVEKRGIQHVFRASAIVTACLHTAPLSAEPCDTANQRTGLFDAVKWRQEACKQYGYADDICPSLMEAVQSYCESPERKTKLLREAATAGGKP